MNVVHCGLIGHPVAHSRSPEIHRAFAEQAGIALDYVLFDATPEEFADRVHEFFAAGGRGLNVTLPHKAAAFKLANEAGEAARRSLVANVLTRLPNGRLRADNTDGIGLVRDLTDNLGFKLSERRVLIAGAGGAVAGIIPTLLDSGVSEIVILNRTQARADELVARVADSRLTAMLSDKLAKASSFDLIVNATSASLHDERPSLPDSSIGDNTLAYDLAYADHATPFMNWAAVLGARTADGWGMLVEQAAESFFFWHGTRPDSSQFVTRESDRSNDEYLLESFTRAVMSDDCVSLEVARISWPSPARPETSWLLTKTFPIETPARTIQLARQTLLTNRQFFFVCLECGKRCVKGHEWVNRICQGCAERNHNVVF